MANQLARDIVQTALSLRAVHPDVPALELLDMAMLGRGDSDPVFDRSDEGNLKINPTGLTFEEILAQHAAMDLAHPNGSFGSLLGTAFGNPWRAIKRWDLEVMLPFAQRYNLWSKRAHLPCAIWRMRCVAAMLSSPEQAAPPQHDDDQPQMDNVDMAEGLAMLAEALYESPLSDGLSPEAAATERSRILR